MDERVGGIVGGISGLYELVKEHREAIHFDLLTLGLSPRLIGTTRFGWDDFAVWVKYMPRSSQLFQSVHGPQWSAELHMLANVVDLLAAANWQRGGGKGGRPKPVKRPGVKSGERFGKAVAFDQVEAFLLARNGRTPSKG